MPKKCPHCNNDNEKMIEKLGEYDNRIKYGCNVCSKVWVVSKK